MLSIKERKLILRWNQEKKTQQEIAKLLGCNQASVSRLIKKYKSKGIIKNLPRSGRPTKLKGKIFSKLKKTILNQINFANIEYNHVSTKKIKNLITEEIGVTYTIRHIERIMHKLGFSLITPRSQHLRHDQEKVDTFRDEFKKNSNQNIWVMK